MLKEIRTRGDIVLFIDEIHTLVGAGAAEGAIDAASILKPMLARGELQTVGATTIDEYRKHLEKDAALERRFQPVKVDQPTVSLTIDILKGLRDRYESHHAVSITDQALVAAANLADRYLADRFLPDKAIDLIDEAGSRLRIRRMSTPTGAKKLDEEITRLRVDKETAIEKGAFEQAKKLAEQEKERLDIKESQDAELRADGVDLFDVVDEEVIAEVLAAWTGIPVYRLTEEETAKLLRMEDELHKRVIGQEEALKALSRAIRRTRAGLKDPKRPSGSFIFLGPTGVGKTELAKTLAEFLFDDEDALIQLDMSEYMEKHTVSRLVGSPPGYVGYEEGGQLTEAVRRKPFSVVLFDEVEKAHPDVFNTLLQILEDGRLTDAQGRSVDFKNTVLIMTSNLGTADLRKSSMGFAKSSEAVTYERMKAKVNDALKSHFRPEFLNRIDEVIVFHELTREEVTEIVDLLMARTIAQLSDQGIGLELTPAARAFLADKGYDPQLGRGRCAGPFSSWWRTRCRSGSCGRSSGSERPSWSTSRIPPSTARARSSASGPSKASSRLRWSWPEPAPARTPSSYSRSGLGRSEPAGPGDKSRARGPGRRHPGPVARAAAQPPAAVRLHGVVLVAEPDHVVQAGRTTLAVVDLVVVLLETVSFSTAGYGTDAIAHEERGVDPLLDASTGARDGADVHPVADDELEPGLAQKFGRGVDADRSDTVDLTELLVLGRAPAQCFGVDQQDRPGPGARSRIRPGIAGHDLEERVEPVGVQRFAGARARGSPAFLRFRLEARADPGPFHLVAEELATDAAALVLVPAEVPIRMYPGPASPLVLPAPVRGPQTGRRVLELLMAGLFGHQGKEGPGRFGGHRSRVGHDLELRRGETAVVESLGQLGGGRRALGRGQAIFGHTDRRARERTKPVRCRGVAVLGERAGLGHDRGEQCDTGRDGPLPLGEERDHRPGFVAGDRIRRGRAHHTLDGSDRLSEVSVR